MTPSGDGRFAAPVVEVRQRRDAQSRYTRACLFAAAHQAAGAIAPLRIPSYRILTTLSSISRNVTKPDPAEELRRLYPPLLTTAHVAEMMLCTIGDVRDKVHRKELPAVRWGNQFRFFRDEVISVLVRVGEDDQGETEPEER